MNNNFTFTKSSEIHSDSLPFHKDILENNKDVEFSKIYISYYPRLVRFAALFVAYEEDAENIVQDLFLGLWEKKDSLKDICNMNAYLYKLLKNKCLDYLKHQLVKDNFIDAARTVYEQEITLRLQSLEYVNPELGSEEKIEKIISNAVNALPPKCREIFILNRFDGLKYKEVAEKLNISVNTVETQMCIAFKKLRNNLDYLLN